MKGGLDSGIQLAEPRQLDLKTKNTTEHTTDIYIITYMQFNLKHYLTSMQIEG